VITRCGRIARVVAGLAVFGALPQLSALASHQVGARDDFGHVAQGLTSSRPTETIEAGYRMFSLPDFKSVCENAHSAQVTKLRPSTSRIRLRVGKPFTPSALKIVALDASGSVLPKVPIAIEVELWTKVLDGKSEHISDGTVTPVRPGTFRFRIRTICEGPAVEIFIDARAGR
jgi:hypothetical protein